MALKHIEKIAIVGATGRIGKSFAEALLKTGKHTVTALTRFDSKGTLPAGVKAVQVDYDDESSIIAAVKGQEFLVITLSVQAPQDLHSRIVQAAAKAGVPYVMPNSYGYDATDQAPGEEALYTKIHLERLEEIKSANLSYIVMTCGFWYQWSLALGEHWFGFDIKNRKVTFYDDGKTAINVSTWDQCGRALAALLSLPESGASPAISDWKNSYLYIDSFKVSQRDMLDSLNRVLGTTDKDWEIAYEPSVERFQNAMKSMKEGGGMVAFARGMYARVFFPNGVGDFETKRGLANDTLGLPKEDVDEATRSTVELVESGWNPFAP